MSWINIFVLSVALIYLKIGVISSTPHPLSSRYSESRFFGFESQIHIAVWILFILMSMNYVVEVRSKASKSYKVAGLFLGVISFIVLIARA